MTFLRMVCAAAVALWFAFAAAYGVPEAAWEIEKDSVYQNEVFDLKLRISHPAAMRLEHPRITGLPAPERLDLSDFREVRPQRHDRPASRETVESVYRAEAAAREPGEIRFEARLNFIAVEERPASFFFRRRLESGGYVDPAPFNLHVRAFPPEGRPPDFDGAVGRFSSVSAIETPLPAAVGELVVIRSELSGYGGIGRLPPPRAAAGSVDPRDFRWYDARERRHGVDFRVFERIIVPLRAGELIVPELTTSYFDPDIEGYVVLTNGPFRIEVNPEP